MTGNIGFAFGALILAGFFRWLLKRNAKVMAKRAKHRAYNESIGMVEANPAIRKRKEAAGRYLARIWMVSSAGLYLITGGPQGIFGGQFSCIEMAPLSLLITWTPSAIIAMVRASRIDSEAFDGGEAQLLRKREYVYVPPVNTDTTSRGSAVLRDAGELIGGDE